MYDFISSMIFICECYQGMGTCTTDCATLALLAEIESGYKCSIFLKANGQFMPKSTQYSHNFGF